MKGTQIGLVIAIVVLFMAACYGDFDLGTRILKLEQRVAELEGAK